MDAMLLRVFQLHVMSQCEFMVIAAREVNAGLESQNVVRTFAALQSLLNAAANVSKALWGAYGGKYANQRQPLRDSIGVTDTSPLRNVVMRNNFEHFDERLDKWWKDSKSQNYFDLTLMPISNITGLDPIDMFRAFDPKTANLHFWGQEFNIQELITEAQRILPTLRAEVSKPRFEAEPPTP